MAEYAPDAIFISDRKVKALANAGTTPFYVYDASGLCSSIRQIQQQFQWCAGYQNFFPLRENGNPALLKILFEGGQGVLACNKAELMLAEQCGFRGERLLYEPLFRDREAALLAGKLDAVWLLNSPNLIPLQPISRALLRVHPQCVLNGWRRSDRAEQSKNGFLLSQLLEAIRLLHVRGVSSIGLSLQGSSGAFRPGILAARASALFQLLPEIQKKTGVSMDVCCLGDSLGPAYRINVNVPQLSDECVQLRQEYEALPKQMRPCLWTTLSKELMERHGILVTKVLEVRNLSRTFLVVDASVCQYIRPALKQAYRHISILGKHQTENRKQYHIVGYLPEEFDRFGEARILPVAEAGDFCVIHDVGCGGRSMPLLYGMRPPCAEYLACPDGQLQQIGFARTEDQVLEFLTAQENKD